MTSIDRLIAGACKAGASDLHLAVGSLPMCRIHGRLQPMAPVAAPDSAPSAMVAVKGSEGYEAETAAGRVSGYIIEPSAGQIAEHPSHLSPDSAIRLALL